MNTEEIEKVKGDRRKLFMRLNTLPWMLLVLGLSIFCVYVVIFMNYVVFYSNNLYTAMNNSASNNLYTAMNSSNNALKSENIDIGGILRMDMI